MAIPYANKNTGGVILTKFRLFAFIIAGILPAAPIVAQEVWITPELPFMELEIGDDFIVIERNQDNSAVIAAAFAKTSRPCPPFCVNPMSAGEGVETVGEVELLAFLEDNVQVNDGYLVDSRTANFYRAGTIPGSINLPFNLFTPSADNPFLIPMLTQLDGVLQTSGEWDFSNSPKLMLFCNGPWCGQSPRAIRNLISLGYPAEKLFYYRGGMQNWLMLGLTVHVP